MAIVVGTATGTTPGVLGTTATTAPGVKGTSSSGYSAIYAENTGGGAALHGANAGAGASAVYADSSGTSGYAVYATSSGNYGTGVYVTCSGSSATGVRASCGDSAYGVYASCSSGYAVYASNYGSGMAVAGFSYSEGAIGVHGSGTHDISTGVRGYGGANSGSCYGIYGTTAFTAAWAGYFDGKVNITTSLTANSISASTKAFVIDHPLDPENKFLRHSSVESSERKNVYDGVGTADAAGEVTVQMPSYFEALNEAFRYQLTPMGAAAPGLFVKEELSQGRFVIGGAAKGQKVCWQVTGNRKDAIARAQPLIVEEDKPADERGFYLNAVAHGQPEEKGIDAERLRRRGGPPSLTGPESRKPALAPEVAP